MNNQNELKEKQADNQIFDKKEINLIESRIDDEKQRLKDIDDLQDKFISINKSINNCLDLLATSIKRKNNDFENMKNDNNHILSNIINVLDEERVTSRRNLNKLYEQKNTIHKDNVDNKEKNNRETLNN